MMPSLTISLQSLKLSSPFTHGSTPLTSLSKPISFPNPRRPALFPAVRAMKTMQGRVVCATNDKTVAVEVVRLAPHPKYKRRVRKKKKYQAHDPDNQFKVGDVVRLEKSRPISKTKSFVAFPVVSRGGRKDGGADAAGNDLGIPLESQQQQQQQV
ncbi:PREDICTED: 30S ribosomal protein S17, chloroplastic [Tarenaya hassleriana]|uniref:30S ribosomal protein S17, chloroplastic n=1 Tax=Tarenaya hassleriana TaxID=28532 RepID=UPI00053C6E72|nr:PREDICTED: 30S ribosomal protein S17, chloroplastic [Tarenaya hassleriana]